MSVPAPFRSRDLGVHAIRFDGTVATAIQITLALGGSDGFTLRKGMKEIPPHKWVRHWTDRDWLLCLPSGTPYAGAGDWIALTNEGDLYALPNNLFHALFQEMDT